MRNFTYVDARSITRAVSLLSTGVPEVSGRAKIIAGGTDLLDELKEGLIAPERLVNIKANPSLKYIRLDATGLHLGVLATLTEVENDAQVREHYPVLAAAVLLIASPQIRNVATVGGNLCQRPRCWYYRNDALHCKRKGGPICYSVAGENTYHAILGGHECYIVHPSDLAPPLMALRAQVTIAGPQGRRTLPLKDFFIGPVVDITRENILAQNELVTEVSVPVPPPGTRGVYLKVRDRATWDFATVTAAAVLTMDGDRCRRAGIVLGAVAPVPWHSPEAEKVLTNARITPEVAEQAAEAALAQAKPMTDNGYKVPLAKNLLRRAILEASGVMA